MLQSAINLGFGVHLQELDIAAAERTLHLSGIGTS
jgi:hypothetical protein